MSAAPASPPRRMTPEEFELLPDAHRWELIDGELVERNMSSYSSNVGAKFIGKLDVYSEVHGGFVGTPDCGLRIFPDRPAKVVFPDACYFSKDRLPEGLDPEGWTTVAPDLVVEVVSPGDRSDELSKKVDEYFRAGVRMVWVAHPTSRRVDVLRAGENGLILVGDAVLTGGDVLPGFEVPIAKLFPRHAAPRPESALDEEAPREAQAKGESA
jgi:Uma2 family endonuclease